MYAFSQPAIIRCVELASQRAAADTRERLSRRVSSLASIAVCAPLIGFFGMLLGMANSFRSMGTSASAALGDLTGRLSEAMVPGILGLLTGLLAFYLHRYLNSQLQTLNLEMNNSSSDLINRLNVYLGLLKKADARVWAALTRNEPAKLIFDSDRTTSPARLPQFNIQRMHRNGVLELIWPRLESDIEASAVSHTAGWVCFGYGLVGFSNYWNQNRPLAAAIAFSFFAISAIGIRRRSMLPALCICSFLFISATACALCGLWDAALWIAPTPVLLIGSLRSAGPLRLKARHLLQTSALLLLGSCATLTVLFGTIFGLYTTQDSDTSMQPTIHAGEITAGVRGSLIGTIQRGELVELSRYGEGTLRVVGLPGERIEISVGKLLINGRLIPETYGKPYEDLSGDFPLPTSAYPDERMAWQHHVAFGDQLTQDTVYIIPDGRYFMLNDDRSQFYDSRTMGPLLKEDIVSRLIFAYNPLAAPLR